MQVKNGHIALGDTSAQNQAVILIVNPGEIKAHPDLGVGVDSIVNDEDTYIWKHEIRRQLAKDVIETFCERKNKTLIFVSHYKDERPACIDHEINL